MLNVLVDIPDARYEIEIGTGLLEDPRRWATCLPQPRAAVVTNTTVAPLYLERLTHALNAAGVEVLPIIVPDGEAYKQLGTVEQIYRALLQARCERQTTLIALGGGVVGDMTGFAAATYLRGVPFVQVPTTLLAQVDSSVGGKTGVNHPLGKNMIGAFYQPRRVVADLDTLSTLPQREYAAGLAEVIKYGLIDDWPLFEWLETHMPALCARDTAIVAEAVAWCCRNKAHMVAADEKESGIRALLNLGHTFGHAIEAGLGYGTWLHGEAVAAGMVLAARVSNRMGRLSDYTLHRVTALIAAAGLPTEAPTLGLPQWLALMAQDKKVSDGQIRFVLPNESAKACMTQVPSDVLAEVLR
jgi:3-dehydroquinate synthase